MSETLKGLAVVLSICVICTDISSSTEIHSFLFSSPEDLREEFTFAEGREFETSMVKDVGECGLKCALLSPDRCLAFDIKTISTISAKSVQCRLTSENLSPENLVYMSGHSFYQVVNAAQNIIATNIQTTHSSEIQFTTQLPPDGQSQITSQIHSTTELQIDKGSTTEIPTDVELQTDMGSTSGVPTDTELQTDEGSTTETPTDVELQTDIGSTSGVPTDTELQTDEGSTTETPTDVELQTDIGSTSGVPTDTELQTDEGSTTETPTDVELQTDIGSTSGVPTDTELQTDEGSTTETPTNAEVQIDQGSTSGVPTDTELQTDEGSTTETPTNAEVQIDQGSTSGVPTDTELQTDEGSTTETPTDVELQTDIGSTSGVPTDTELQTDEGSTTETQQMLKYTELQTHEGSTTETPTNAEVQIDQGSTTGVPTDTELQTEKQDTDSTLKGVTVDHETHVSTENLTNKISQSGVTASRPSTGLNVPAISQQSPTNAEITTTRIASSTTQVAIITETHTFELANTTQPLNTLVDQITMTESIDAAAKVGMYFEDGTLETGFLLFYGFELYIYRNFFDPSATVFSKRHFNETFTGADPKGGTKVQAAMVYGSGNSRIALLYNNGEYDFFDTRKGILTFEVIGDETLNSPCQLDSTILAIVDEDDDKNQCIYVTTGGIRHNVKWYHATLEKLRQTVNYINDKHPISAAMAIRHTRDVEPYTIVLFSGQRCTMLKWSSLLNYWRVIK
ncbi:uncharacterized protein LOC143245647 [Tachypleus tridentatus]|uniref:uncharacterized protein LOC143245647 n=1 Tax=Tachypleus tridentatus TaxID=6853 RepID=UPI003FD0D326